MKAVLEKNLACLEKKFPHVYTVVEKFYSENEQDKRSGFYIDQTKNGLFNIKVTTENASLYVHSNYNPENEANTLLKSESIQNNDTFVIFGFGVGYHVEKIVKEFPKKNKLIIEPDVKLFSLVLENRDITNILENKNVELIIPECLEQAAQELMALYQLGHISNIEFLALPSYQRLFNQYWDDLREHFAKFLRTFTVNVRTTLVFKNMWINNFFYNLKHVIDSADLLDFQGQFESVPAIIVSSGPSLVKNIELLKEIGNKAIIISAGSAVTALKKAGIKPHFMLGIDGGPDSARIFNDVEWDDVLFTYVMNLHYQALDNYSGPKLYIKGSAEHQVDWLERKIDHVTPAIVSGGSCANLCLDFVKRLGCNPVMFIGQDLAYTNMQTHADGCIDSRVVDEDNFDTSKLKKVKDIYGEDIYTADIFMTMGYTFEAYIARFTEEHIFINATEGGLNIKGTKVMKFKEAINQYCDNEIDVSLTLKDLYEKSKTANKDLEPEIIKFVEAAKKHATKIKEYSEKRLKLSDKINQRITKNDLEISKQRKSLFDLTKKIERDVLFKEILEPSCRDINLVFKNNTESRAEQSRNLKDKLEILYSGLKRQYQEIAEKNLVVSITAKESLKRLKEENE